MISTRGLAALRVAATLTHSIPQLRARLSHGDDQLVDIRFRGPHDTTPRTARLELTPCQFRRAVARAHHEHCAGNEMAMLGLPLGVDPAVEIGTPSRGASLPGGLYRVPHKDRWLWAFATTLDAQTAFDLGLPLVDEALAELQVTTLGLRSDPCTEVNLAYAETDAGPGTTAEGALVDLLQSLLARWATAELLESLTSTAPESGTGLR